MWDNNKVSQAARRKHPFIQARQRVLVQYFFLTSPEHSSKLRFLQQQFNMRTKASISKKSLTVKSKQSNAHAIIERYKSHTPMFPLQKQWLLRFHA